MTKNREIAEHMFGVMRKLGFKPYNIEYGNGYFLFDRGEDSVIHFRLKGVWKHWKFGMWVNSEYLEEKYREEERYMDYKDYYKVVQIFAQHDTWLDKFKPSRSDLCVAYEASDWNRCINGTYVSAWCKLEDMLKMMRRHPFMCYSGFCGEYAGYVSESFIWNYITCEVNDKIQKLKEALMIAIWYPWTLFKCFFAKRAKCISELTIYNFEKENPGWSTDYKYEVRVKFAKDSTEEEETKWLDKWFYRWRYGKYGYYDCAVKLDPCFTKEGRDGAYSYELLCDLKRKEK